MEQKANTALQGCMSKFLSLTHIPAHTPPIRSWQPVPLHTEVLRLSFCYPKQPPDQLVPPDVTTNIQQIKLSSLANFMSFFFFIVEMR